MTLVIPDITKTKSNIVFCIFQYNGFEEIMTNTLRQGTQFD